MGKSSVSQYLSGRSVQRQEVQERITDVLECTVGGSIAAVLKVGLSVG